VATVQSLKNLLDEKFLQEVDIVVVDEAHHVSSFSLPFARKDQQGSYARVLSTVPAPIRLGFTATLPYIEQARMSLEGYIGPVISEVKAKEVERLAKIRIRLRKLPPPLPSGTPGFTKMYTRWGGVNSRRNRGCVVRSG